jgi:hypothetical protein
MHAQQRVVGMCIHGRRRAHVFPEGSEACIHRGHRGHVFPEGFVPCIPGGRWGCSLLEVGGPIIFQHQQGSLPPSPSCPAPTSTQAHQSQDIYAALTDAGGFFSWIAVAQSYFRLIAGWRRRGWRSWFLGGLFRPVKPLGLLDPSDLLGVFVPVSGVAEALDKISEAALVGPDVAVMDFMGLRSGRVLCVESRQRPVGHYGPSFTSPAANTDPPPFRELTSSVCDVSYSDRWEDGSSPSRLCPAPPG